MPGILGKPVTKKENQALGFSLWIEWLAKNGKPDKAKLSKLRYRNIK